MYQVGRTNDHFLVINHEAEFFVERDILRLDRFQDNRSMLSCSSSAI